VILFGLMLTHGPHHITAEDNADQATVIQHRVTVMTSGQESLCQVQNALLWTDRLRVYTHVFFYQASGYPVVANLHCYCHAVTFGHYTH